MFLSCFNLAGVAEEIENLPNVRTNFNYQYTQKANFAEELERKDSLRSPVLSEDQEYESKYGEAVEKAADYTTYQTDDNKFLTVFDTMPNKYTDKNGKEKEIVLDLEEKAFSYENTTNSVNVKFAKTFSEKKAVNVSLPNGEYEFSLIPAEGDYSKEVVKGNAVLYNNVFENIDVQYTLNELGYKEDIILRAPTEVNEYQYFLNFEGKVEEKEGSVLLYNEQGEVVYTLNAPVMMDANEQTSSDIELSLSKQGGRNIVTLTASKEWLGAEERVFPVVIDPSVTIPQTELQIYNTPVPYNSSEETLLNYVHNQGFFAVTNNQILNSIHTNIALIQVANTVTDFLPNNATIEHADLVLNQSSSHMITNSNNAIFECRQVNMSWSFESHFSNYQIINTSTIPGENYIVNTNYLTQEQIEDGERRFDITETMDGWLYGEVPNNGLLVEATNNAGGYFYGINAAEQYASKRPKIEIEWSLTNVDTQSSHVLTAHVSPIISKDENDVVSVEGLFFSGNSNSHDIVGYKLPYLIRPVAQYSFNVEVGNQNIYPNSNYYGENYPQNASPVLGNTDNWQAKEIFAASVLQTNKLYCLEAAVFRNSSPFKEIKGDKFILYHVIQGDTLANIANYYGTPLETLETDNDLENSLLVAGSTLFVRNPKVYEPKDVAKSAKSFDLTNRAHSESVDYASGNFYLENTDVSVPFYNDAISITRRYNSGAAGTENGFGYGWQFEFAEYISKDAEQNINYSRADGSTIQFVYNGTDYICERGYNLDLEIEDIVVGNETFQEYTISFSDGTQKFFDTIGNLKTIRYKGGYSTQLIYDTNNKLLKVQSPTGKEFQFEYYTNNRIKKIKLPDDNYLNYTYDNMGNLIEFKDQLNQITHYTYDENHRMLSWTDGRNVQRLTNTYDSSGKVVTQADANSNVTQFTYNSTSTNVINPAGQTKSYYFDSFKRTLRREDLDSDLSISYTYNYNNDILTYKDELGNVTSYTYDSKGNVLTSTRFDGKSMEFTYDENSNLLTKKDYKSYITTYTYDSNNNLIGITNPDNSTQSFTYNSNGMLSSSTDGNNNQTTYTYDSNSGLLSSVTYPNNGVESYYYNSMNLLSKKVEADESQTLYSYDACGRKVTEVLPGQATITYVYDAADNLISTTDARNATTTYTYDGQCNLLSETDALNNTISYTYDSLGNQVSKTDGLGNTIYYSYDNNGKILTATFDNQIIESYQYDVFGNKTRDVNLVNSSYSHHYTYDYRFNQINRSRIGTRYTDSVYDDNGNLISATDNAGNTTTYTYDSMNRVISTTDPNGGISSVEYDGNGNVTKTIDPLGNITLYSYDAMNNNVSITNPNGGIITKTYDALNRLSSETDAKGNVTEYTYYENTDKVATKTLANEAGETYTYDLNGNLTEFEDAEENVTTYHYDYLNRLISTEYPNEGVENIEYDANSNVTKKTDQIGGTLEYTYDINGNVLTQKDCYNNIYSFEYDLNGNLIKQTNPDGNELLYTYNNYGDPAKVRHINGTTSTITYNSIGQKNYDYIDGVKHAYVYDANGNVTQETVGTGTADKQITTYIYDLNNRVVSETLQGTKTTAYTYDSMGNVTSITDPAGNVTRKYYDLNSNLIKEVDALGREYLYTYDSMNQLVEEENPLHQTKEYEYDNLGNATKETDEAGNYVSYSYDEIGNISSKTDKNGNTTQYEYDLLGNLIKTTNADSGEIKNLYDKNSNLIKVQDALNNITQYTYNSMNQCVSKQLPVGGSYHYEYDMMGNLTKTTDPLGNETLQSTNKYGKISGNTSPTGVTTNYTYTTVGNLKKESSSLGDKNYTYDSYGNLVSQTDLLGNATTFTYDVVNNQLSSTDALNNTTTYTYDAVGNKLSETSPIGAVTNYTYDALNRVTQEVSVAAQVIKSNTYNETGKVTRIETTSNGVSRVSEFDYDNNGNITNQRINGVQTQFVYNSMNQKEEEIAVFSNSVQHTTSFEYDFNGNLVNKTSPTGGEEFYAYDGNGNCSSVTDANNHTTEYTYNALGKITKVENPLGAETEYSYDSLMNVTKVTDALDNETNYTYDDYGRLTSVEDALGNTESYTYNANGLKTSKTDGNDNTISYTYDSLNRLTEKSYSLFNSVEFEYDAASRRTSMTDSTGETEYTYDLAGRLTKVKSPDENEVNYEYNGFGDVTRITYPNGETAQYIYNNKGLVTSLIKGTGYINYFYNSLNQLTQKTFANNGNVLNKQTFSYSSTGKVLTAKVSDGAVRPNYISKYTYTYDAADNITSETIFSNSQTVTKAYTYDALGQVKTETTTDANNNTISAKSFNYDLVGNQVERSSDGTQTTRVYNANNQLTRTIKGSVITDYTYDANGNLISEESGSSEIEYSYDKENNLLSVVKDDILQMSAVYNGDGDRIMSANKITTPKNAYSLVAGSISGNTVDDTYSSSLYNSLLSAGGSSVNASDYDITTYVNDVTKQNEQVLMEYNASGNVTEEYYYGLQREIYKHDTATEYYMYDGRGSVANLTTSTGAMKIAYSYDTFGEATITPAANVAGSSNVFDYNAEATDYNTGFQYLRSRYYNPVNASFITQDSYKGSLSNPQTQNNYSYTGNNPVNRKDPSGKSWQGDLFKELFGVIGTDFVGELKNRSAPKNPTIHEVILDIHDFVKQSLLDSLFVPDKSDSKEVAAVKRLAGAVYYDFDYIIDEAKDEFKEGLKAEVKESVRESSKKLATTVLKKAGKYAAKETIKFFAPKVLNATKDVASKMGGFIADNAKIAFYELRNRVICSASAFVSEIKYWAKAQASAFISDAAQRMAQDIAYGAKKITHELAQGAVDNLKYKMTRAIPGIIKNGFQNAVNLGRKVESWVHRQNDKMTNYLNSVYRSVPHNTSKTHKNSGKYRGVTHYDDGGVYIGKPTSNELLVYLQKDTNYYKKSEGILKAIYTYAGYFDGTLNGKGSYDTNNGANVFFGLNGKASVFYGNALLSANYGSIGLDADLLTASASAGLKSGLIGDSYDLGVYAGADAAVFKTSASFTINLDKVHITVKPYISILSAGAKFNYGYFQNGFTFESSVSSGIGKGVSVNVYWK